MVEALSKRTNAQRLRLTLFEAVCLTWLLIDRDVSGTGSVTCGLSCGWTVLSKQNLLDQQSITFLDMKVDLQVGVYGFGSEALRKGDWWHSMMRVLMGREDPEETQKRLQSLNKYVSYLQANHAEKVAARACFRPSILMEST